MNKNKESNFVSSVVYVHDCENNIEHFLSELNKVLSSNFNNYEIICINDFSKDNSVEIIKRFAKNIKKASLTLINLSSYHGLELAMNAGVDLSIGDFVFEFDSTYVDYDCKEIMNIYCKSLEGFDIVSASSNKKQRFTSSLFYKIFNKFSYNSAKMNTESFRILTRRAINRTGSMNKSMPYRKAVYNNCGLKTTNIVYEAIQNNNEEKIDKGYRANLAIDSLIIFTDFGYKVSIGLDIVMLCIAVFISLYTLIVYTSGNPVEGWTTTIMFLSIAFFGLFALLAIIIKYLQIIVDLDFRRNRYNFESIEKLTK